MIDFMIGGISFREIRETSCYYADKTAFLEEFFSTVPPKVSLITRPRRFGKTLMMNMLYEFFDITRDSKAIFEGLAISKNKALCGKWMNQYPTVFITLKDVEGLAFYDALTFYADAIGALCAQNKYLYDSPRVEERDKEKLRELESTHDKNLLAISLLILVRALHAHWGKPVIVLIDEYDLPLSRAQENGYYREMVSFIRSMLGAVLKDYTILQFGILTGGLRISKESLFGGLNNFQCFGISEPPYADKFGFTSEEVDDLLSATGFLEKKEEIKTWYDGYRFGKNTEIYCPWDILQYISFLQKDPDTEPEAYWENSSADTAIRCLIERTGVNVRKKIEGLLIGKYVTSNIIKTITYDTLYESEDNLWTLLYLSGYLTKADPLKVGNNNVSSDSQKMHLVIPNKEVQIIFIETINKWFKNIMKTMDRKPLFDAFWNGDSEGFQEQFSRILLKSISYNDYHENFYHAVLTGTFIGAGWEVSSNDESGLGRLDIFINDEDNSRAAIIEVKHSDTLEAMPKDAEDAIRQIEVNKYVTNFEGHYDKIMFWGISFCKKFCVARARDYSWEEFMQLLPANIR